VRGWPFEGRETELREIRSAFTGVDVDAIVFTAPAGVGKTRLARQALSVLGADRCVWVGATRAAAGIPFAAVAPLLPDETAREPLAMIRAAIQHLHRWGGRHAVALAVDDAHLLDDASATLVARLAMDRAAFIIMTLRTGEPIPDVLSALWKEGTARCVELPPLPEDAIDRLIDHAGPGELDARSRRRLHKVARGNPLALRELLHGAQPGDLSDLAAARLDGLDPEARHVVELVACGEPVALSVLDRLVGLPAVTAAEDSGLILVERSGARTQARLEHPLYGDVLRGRLTVSRATQVYRSLADALLATPLARREDTLLAACWQVDGGRISRPAVVRAGAWQAIGRADLALAERLARAARAAEPGAEADRLLAEILTYRGRRAEAAQVLPAKPPRDPADRVPWAITRSEALYWGGDRAEPALATLDAAGGHHAAEAARSWLLFFDGRCADAVRVSAEVLDRVDADARSQIWAAAAGAAANGFLGHADRATQIHRQGAAVAAAHADALPWGAFEVDVGGCLAHLAGGRPAAAQAIAAAGYQAVLEGGAAMMVSGWALYGGLAATARGHLADADRLLTEAQIGFERNDTFRLTRCCLAARAAVAALCGVPGAAALMARADVLAHPSNRVFEPWIEMWRAWAAYAGRDLRRAIATADRAAELARAADMPAVEALARYDVARLGGRVDLARLDEIDDDLARLLASAAHALSVRDGAAALESAARALQARGYDQHAAEVLMAATHHHQRHGRIARANLAAANAAALHPAVQTPLLHPARLIETLTARERDVVLLAAGHTSAEIADRLQLAVSTVNNNLARAYAKLGITGRADLRDLLDNVTDQRP